MALRLSFVSVFSDVQVTVFLLLTFMLLENALRFPSLLVLDQVSKKGQE